MSFKYFKIRLHFKSMRSTCKYDMKNLNVLKHIPIPLNMFNNTLCIICLKINFKKLFITLATVFPGENLVSYATHYTEIKLSFKYRLFYYIRRRFVLNIYPIFANLYLNPFRKQIHSASVSLVGR